MLVVKAARSGDEIEALAPAWDALLEREGRGGPFLGHDWFLCCLRAYGSGAEPLVLVARKDERVVGIAPIWIRRKRIRGIPVRSVEFIEGLDTPYADLVLASDQREEVLRALLASLLVDHRSAWDLCQLGRWPAASANLRLATKLLDERRFRYAVERSSALPYLRLVGSFEEFLGSRSAKYRKTARNIQNRMGRLSDVTVERHVHDPTGSVLRDVLAVSRKSWKHLDAVGVASRDEALAFFEAYTAIASRRGWLLVWLIRLAGEPIAMEYDLQHDGVVHALRADFDERYRDYSPGTYLQLEILKQLYASGAGEYNTGPGMSQYKLRTADEVSQNSQLTVFNRSARGRAAWLADRVALPILRRLLRRGETR